MLDVAGESSQLAACLMNSSVLCARGIGVSAVSLLKIQMLLKSSASCVCGEAPEFVLVKSGCQFLVRFAGENIGVCQQVQMMGYFQRVW